MSAPEIKNELQKLIAAETDISILKAIHTLLQKTSLDPILKEQLIKRALRSEADILSGNTLTKAEVIKRTSP